MGNKKGSDLRVIISIFGPIAVLFIALVVFQYESYKSHRDRMEYQLQRGQAVVTAEAASAMRKEQRDDFIYLLGFGTFFIIALAGGGVYFMGVFKAKATAEAEAAYQTSLAAQGEALAAEKDKLVSVLDSIPDAVMLIDRHGKVLAANSKTRDILGVSYGGPLLEDLADMPDDFPLRSLLGCSGDDGDKVIGNKTYRLLCVPVAGSRDGDLKEVRILRDITVERSLEQKKSDLVSMITHDIKSPMTAIIGMCQWMTQEEIGEGLSEDGVKALESISRAARRMTDLMDNFVLLTSLEGMDALKRQPVDLNMFMGKALVEFHMQARNKDIKFRHNLEEASAMLHLDEVQLMRAVANVVNNALKYTPEGGVVSVSAKKFKGYAAITVSDTGPGIAKDELPFIFDRYYRASNTGGIKGSGLGLAIAKAVVEAHGGSIDVDSDVGMGATFTLRLPLYSPSENN